MYLGIDGKSFLSGQNYAAVPADAADRRVLEAVQKRDEKAAKEALQSLSENLFKIFLEPF
jgi:hypothetical protein